MRFHKRRVSEGRHFENFRLGFGGHVITLGHLMILTDGLTTWKASFTLKEHQKTTRNISINSIIVRAETFQNFCDM